MATPLPPAYRAYSLALAAGGAAFIVMLAVATGVALDTAEGVVLLVGLAATLPGAVVGGSRSTISLNHLPILAAALIGSPFLAPALAAALAAIDTRAFGRWAVISNAGGTALAAAAAVGAFGLAGAGGLPRDPGEPLWFFSGVLAATAFFLVNHVAVSGMIALKYREPLVAVWRRSLRPMVAGDLIGSTILIGSVGLVAGSSEPGMRAVAAIVTLVAVGLLLTLIVRSRDHEQAVAEREGAVAEREDAIAGRELAMEMAARAVSRLNDVASGTVPVLVAMIDLRDRYTARHSAGVGRLCRLVAERLDWTPEDQALAHLTGLVHDIGKVGLPDDVLRKPGRPDPEEWALIHRHPDWGADALAEMRLMPAAVDGVRAHHERWDGSGYPHRLAGVEIPALGRLVAVCDSYDAMTGVRPFRGSKCPLAAREELAQLAGRLYDPVMTHALLEVLADMGELDELRAPREFAAEWRAACAGVDMERIYVRVSADLERLGERLPVPLASPPGLG